MPLPVVEQKCVAIADFIKEVFGDDEVGRKLFDNEVEDSDISLGGDNLAVLVHQDDILSLFDEDGLQPYHDKAVDALKDVPEGIPVLVM